MNDSDFYDLQQKVENLERDIRMLEMKNDNFDMIIKQLAVKNNRLTRALNIIISKLQIKEKINLSSIQDAEIED